MNEHSNCAKKHWIQSQSFPATDSPLYCYLFENAPLGIVHYNSDGVILSCNDKFVGIAGVSRNELIGRDLRTLQEALFYNAISEALSGQASTYEGIYKVTDSNIETAVRAEFHPVIDQGGIELGIGMVQDITKQYLAEEKVRESKQRFHTIFNKNHNVILLIDLETGLIKDANSAALKFYGWSKDQIQKKKISDINMLSDEQIKDRIDEVRRKGEHIFYFKHLLADGSIRDVEVYSGLVSFEGDLCLFSIVHDISDQMSYHLELLKFKLGIERSSNIILITDREGKIEYVNPSFTREYGYSLEEVKGKTPRILKSGIHDISFYERFWETISNGREMQGELINKTKGGENLSIRFSCNPIINDEGLNIGYIAIQENITEQKKRDEKLRESLQEKEVMLSEIHHRVKNNMAIISGLLELSFYQDDNQDIEKFIQDSQFRIKAMANVHELLYQSETFSTVPFKEYANQLVGYITSGYTTNEKTPEVNIDVDEIELNINQAIPCGLMMNEITLYYLKQGVINNYQPRINISLKKKSSLISLVVENHGFLNEDGCIRETGSFGLTLVNVLSKQLEANLTWKSTSYGAKTTISFEERKYIKGAASAFI